MQITPYFTYLAITVLMAWVVLGKLATWLSVSGCGISLLGVAFIAKSPFISKILGKACIVSHSIGLVRRFARSSLLHDLACAVKTCMCKYGRLAAVCECLLVYRLCWM